MLKIIIDLFPVIAFFVAFKMSGDMLMATQVVMISAIIQIALMKIFKITIKPMHWISFALIVVLGAIALIFREPLFLKWKFSVLEWSMALAILVGQFVFNKNMLKLLMGNELSLPDNIWKKLSILWAVFFIFLGTLNIFIAYWYDDAVWVNFKTYGALGLSILFMIAQGIWLSRYIKSERILIDD